ncbi:hypothetical protein [Brenneria goodwinii]
MTLFNDINEIPAPRCDTSKTHELMDVIFLTFAAALRAAIWMENHIAVR